jgi:hypothetical protein
MEKYLQNNTYMTAHEQGLLLKQVLQHVKPLSDQVADLSDQAVDLSARMQRLETAHASLLEEARTWDEMVCREILVRARRKLSLEGHRSDQHSWVQFVQQLDDEWLRARGLSKDIVGLTYTINEKDQEVHNISASEFLATINKLEDSEKLCYMSFYNYLRQTSIK